MVRDFTDDQLFDLELQVRKQKGRAATIDRELLLDLIETLRDLYAELDPDYDEGASVQ